ncbi:MAG: hypothetical protein AUI14_22110 [Actinobacteria bacterium 13_2_20CM_2_71_6]|nr:MAG: hypothetical protein AUI14_22110 [Actinobacteria bacterium 13_2_20CM_2_71_6]
MSERRDGLSGDDLQWRRPAQAGGPAPGTPPAPQQPPGPPPYAGPPRTTPPPRGWRPRLLVQPPPPRELPAQDLARIDAEEREARTITYGIGLMAGAILLVVLLILCGRALF